MFCYHYTIISFLITVVTYYLLRLSYYQCFYCFYYIIICVFTFYKDLPEGNGDSTNKMVTKTTMWWWFIYLFTYLFIYLSWINGWDDISVCEAKKPRYAVPIMEGYKKILLVAGGTQLGYVTAAYISCSLDTLSDHPSMGIPGRFFDGRICGSCHFYRYPAWQAAT